MLKLTNASPEHDGNPILINPKHILTIFEYTQDISDSVKITATNIYAVTQQSWLVKESVDTIYEMMNDKL